MKRALLGIAGAIWLTAVIAPADYSAWHEAKRSGQKPGVQNETSATPLSIPTQDNQE